jgi:hypothetical protein
MRLAREGGSLWIAALTGREGVKQFFPSAGSNRVARAHHLKPDGLERLRALARTLPRAENFRVWHHKPMDEPISDSERLRRQVDELRETAQRLIDEAARLLAKSTELEKQISSIDSRRR